MDITTTTSVASKNREHIVTIYNKIDELAVVNLVDPTRHVLGQPKNFTLKKQIPSCSINKELIVNLEKLIEKELVEYFEVHESNIYKSITISDERGDETISSIMSRETVSFSNKTSEINVRIRDRRRSILQCNITFAKNKTSSKVTIDVESSSPKEDAERIFSKILQVLSDHKTLSFIFYPPDFCFAIYPLCAFFIVAGYALIASNNTIGLWFFWVAWVIILYGISHFLMPYCGFESPALNIKKAILKFLWAATLLSVLAEAGRKYFLNHLWQVGPTTP
jgi:hypothetical protein